MLRVLLPPAIAVGTTTTTISNDSSSRSSDNINNNNNQTIVSTRSTTATTRTTTATTIRTPPRRNQHRPRTRTRTPLQRTILQRQYYPYQPLHRILRYVLVLLSALYLFSCLVYCTYLVIAPQPRPSLQQQQRCTVHYRIFDWKEDKYASSRNGVTNDTPHPESIAVSVQHLTTTKAVTSKIYDALPWKRIFTATTPTTTSSSLEGSRASQQQPQPQQSNDSNDDDNNYDNNHENRDSDNNNDDSDDDNTMGQAVPAQHHNQRRHEDNMENEAASRDSSHSVPTQDSSSTSKSHTNTADASQSQSTTAKGTNNPALYGWTPNQYPDPIHDPVRCAISYILPHLQQEQQQNERMNDPPPSDRMNSPTYNDHYYNNNNNTNYSKNNDLLQLRLCDPDWVLGGIYLEDVAMALYNFSTAFGIHRPQNNDNNSNEDREDKNERNTNTGSISNTNSESSTMTSGNEILPAAATEVSAPTTTTTAATTSTNRNDWNIEVGPSNRRRQRQLLQEEHRSLRQVADTFVSMSYHSFTKHHGELKSIDKHRVTPMTTPITKENANDNSNYYEFHKDLLTPPIELAVVTVRKMNIPLVLRQGNIDRKNYDTNTYNSNGNNDYYSNFYENENEDDDDMVNDAAQIFARTLHDQWWSSTAAAITIGSTSATTATTNEDNDPANYGILLFLSVQDRVCFISTGSSISVTLLPWWRLDHIVTNMKPDLQNRDYGSAILRAIQDISDMLQTGPPTISDRIHDFITRFGIVIAFATFTFCFGVVRIGFYIWLSSLRL
jgi:TPM domain